ncbi:MAG: hypothetical protein KJ864_00705, partial [Candidatus Omnitrophica bacterium]|nr:hypothetical protein [Candidatus Omnitrophota bacterium]
LEEMAFYLKKAGCFSIAMSIESADDDIRIRMMRRKVEKSDLEKAFSIFKEHKINVYANTMLALPFTKLEDDIASVDFAIKVKPEMPNFSIFMPYPGTDLGDYCARIGVYDVNQNHIEYGMRNASSLKCFTKKEKDAQYNLCELAIIAVKLPFLRNLIVNHLIHWSPNNFFFFMHYIFSITAYGKKIFYFKHTFFEYFELLGRTLKHYIYDFLKGEKKDMCKEKQEKINKCETVLAEKERKEELEKCMEAMETGEPVGWLAS